MPELPISQTPASFPSNVVYTELMIDHIYRNYIKYPSQISTESKGIDVKALHKLQSTL